MLRRPTLRQIDVFRAVIELGSVSKASVALGMTQPTASKLLAYLEADSGLRLFDRLKRKLVPTAVGLRLYEEVERIFSGVDQIERAIDALHRQELERLTVCVIPVLESVAVMAASRFMQRNPGVELSIEMRGSPHIPKAIGNQRVDVGIFGGEIDSPDIQSRTILGRPLVCIVSPDHTFAGRPAVMAEDLDAIPLIRHASLNRTQQLIDRMCAQAGVSPAFRLEMATARMMCEAITAGMGIGIAHPVAMTGFADRLASVPLQPPLHVDYQIGWLAKNRNSRLIGAFIEEIAAVCEAMP